MMREKDDDIVVILHDSIRKKDTCSERMIFDKKE